MAFKTKLILSDNKFELPSGSTFTVEGNLILDNNNITGGTQIVNKNYVDSQLISGGSSSVYTGASPSNVAVGALDAGTTLTGLTLSQILEGMLTTVFTPDFNAPSVTLTEDVNNTQEVGSEIDIIYTATFDRGDINLTTDQGTTRQGDRSGQPTGYTFSGIEADSVITTNDTAQITLTNYTVQEGANNESVSVDYEEGIQPLDSNGDPSGSPLAAGSVSDAAPSINGIYPYFFGTSASKPTAGSTLLTNADQKVVNGNINGTVTVSFGASGEFTWIALPATATNKTVWYVTALDNGDIDTTSPSSDLYVRTDAVTVNSPDGLWSGVDYDFYISEISNSQNTVEFRNS